MFRKCDICKRETDTTYEYHPHDDVCVSCCDEMDKEVFTDGGRKNMNIVLQKMTELMKPYLNEDEDEEPYNWAEEEQDTDDE